MSQSHPNRAGIAATVLHHYNAGHDKVYVVWVARGANGWQVMAAYGARTKQKPLIVVPGDTFQSFDTASRAKMSIISEKTRKGYINVEGIDYDPPPGYRVGFFDMVNPNKVDTANMCGYSSAEREPVAVSTPTPTTKRSTSKPQVHHGRVSRSIDL